MPSRKSSVWKQASRSSTSSASTSSGSWPGISLSVRRMRLLPSSEGVDRIGERVGNELLGGVGEGALVVEVADVVARREHRPVACDDQAAGGLLADYLRDGVEDLVVEGAALGGVRDLEPDYAAARLVDYQLAGRPPSQEPPACRPRTPPVPPRRRSR